MVRLAVSGMFEDIYSPSISVFDQWPNAEEEALWEKVKPFHYARTFPGGERVEIFRVENGQYSTYHFEAVDSDGEFLGQMKYGPYDRRSDEVNYSLSLCLKLAKGLVGA